MLCYVMICYCMLCMLCYVMLWYAMSVYAMLSYVLVWEDSTTSLRKTKKLHSTEKSALREATYQNQDDRSSTSGHETLK